VFSFCKLRLRYHRQTHRHQHQGDIRPSARDYENKEITIYGTVTDATSMLIVKYFEIQDDTGKIKVVTDRLLPAKGEKLKVTGRTGIIEVWFGAVGSASGEERAGQIRKSQVRSVIGQTGALAS
jgi:hypothetical protein